MSIRDLMKSGTLILLLLLSTTAYSKVSPKHVQLLNRITVPSAKINPFILFELSARTPNCVNQEPGCLRNEEALAKKNLEEKVRVVSKQLDQYFNALIGSYTPQIQKELKKMYYDQVYVFEDALHVETGGDFGVTRGSFFPNRIELKVHLDRKIARTALFSKIVLIHEIGVHAGQTWDLFTKGGPAKFHELMQSPVFRTFTELSAAFVMKRIFDSIDPEVLEYDILTNVPHQIVREAIFKHCTWVKSSQWKTSAWLLGKRTLESRYADQSVDYDFVKSLSERFENSEQK